MKYAAFAFLLFFSFPVFSDNSPCNDPVYIDLKSRDVNSMTDREFEIYKFRNSTCAEYQKTEKLIQPTQDLAQSTNGWMTVYIILGIISIIPLLIL